MPRDGKVSDKDRKRCNTLIAAVNNVIIFGFGMILVYSFPSKCVRGVAGSILKLLR